MIVFDINKECYNKWHSGYREFQHVCTGNLKNKYKREMYSILANILIHCGADYLDYYMALMKSHKNCSVDFNVQITTDTAFFLYIKNYKDLPRIIRMIIGTLLMLKKTYRDT
jgi:hypothetical protein